jgi:SM-20-related protein
VQADAVTAGPAHRAEGIAALVDGVATRGYAIVPQFVEADVVAQLRSRAEDAFAQGRMHPARVGRATTSIRDAGIRGDAIAWLDEVTSDPTERALAASLEAVRLAVNASLWLGLFDFEGHYARYSAGAFYARHLDRFRDQDTRTLFRDGEPPLDVPPRGGTLAAFLAERFEHEVLPATRTRWSFTGWFRRRPR